jgi:hypothetical protein
MVPAASITDVCPVRPAHGALLVRRVHVTPAPTQGDTGRWHQTKMRSRGRPRCRGPSYNINTASPCHATRVPEPKAHPAVRRTHTVDSRTHTRAGARAKMPCRWNCKPTLICAPTNAHRHTQAYARARAHTDLRMHKKARTNTHTRMNPHRRCRTHAHTRRRVRAHKQGCTDTPTLTDSHTHTHTHARARTHTHAHACACACVCF